MPRPAQCLLLVCALSLVAVAGAGCGSSTPTTSDKGPTAGDALGDRAALLKDYQQAKGRAPASLAAMGGADVANPAASAALARKEIVYLWGHAITLGETGIIAHETAAPTAGGYVLLQDGTVKKVTAAEFAAAPKPKK